MGTQPDWDEVDHALRSISSGADMILDGEDDPSSVAERIKATVDWIRDLVGLSG